MSKLLKEMISTELKGRYEAVENAVWIDFIGVDGLTNTELRRNLRGKEMSLEVVKTSLLRVALKGSKLAPLAAAMEGPAALVTGGASAVAVAKALESWAPRIKTLKLRGAILEGEFIDEQRVGGLAKMPTKRDLQGQVASCLMAPGARLASAILSPGGKIAGCLKALIEKLEKAGDGAAVESAPAA